MITRLLAGFLLLLVNLIIFIDNINIMKKNFILTTILFASILASCNITSTTTDSNTDTSTTIDTSTDTKLSDSTSTSQGGNTTNTSTNTNTITTDEKDNYEQLTIKQVNELCNNIKENGDVNVQGSKKVSITGRMMFAESINCTQKGYLPSNAYKLFVYDETGYIYVGVNADRYNNVFSKYEYSNTAYYTFNGTINKYLGQNEVIMESYQWLGDVPSSLTNDVIKSFTSKINTMDEIYTLDSSLSLNNKGIAYSSVVAFEGKYVDKVENAVALFANGINVMRVHGSTKLNNNFNSVKTEEELSNSATYIIYGVLSVYNYIPEVQYLFSEKSENVVTYDLTKATKLSANELWKLTPDKDKLKTSHYKEYEEIAKEIHYFEGYVNFTNYGGKNYMVLTDTYVENNFTSSINESNGKALRINNEGETGLATIKDDQYSIFANLYVNNSSQKIRVYFTTYSYNTNHYWQIQIFNKFNIQTID